MAFSRSLPAATEDRKWGDHPVFSVAGKMFCIFSDELPLLEQVSIAADPERFLELTEQPGISPAPYLARYHWIAVSAQSNLSSAALHLLIEAGYRRVLSKLPKAKQAPILAELDARR